ncbi:Mbeg1-like protein, partial [Lactobacillus crispatus]
MYPDNNILTYLKWRGDVDFSTSPFNDIDALVLSIFSYLELPGIVKSNGTTISLEKAAKLYFADDHPRYDNLQYQELFKLMAHADRFKNAKLSYFISTLTEHTQFSAIKIELTDGTNFIAFRGTDDSLIGWKEDFEISFKITVAQQQAVKLLETILKADDQDYYLGGHSKGGNLAEYAAINIEPKLRKRIKRIYTFDSPGIAEEIGAQLPNKYLQNTLRRFVPDFSVIGRLFESKNIPATIVDSTRKGLSQHDAFSWQIIGSNFDT